MLKSNPKDILDPMNDKLNGIYRGVVEDNSSDPEKMGRCKIRVFGIHSPNKVKDKTDGIPTDELPWCDPVMGLFEGSMSGFGAFTVPLQGSHVFVFFEGGNIMNPRYFATVPGKPTDQNHGLTDKQGFSDPDNVYPKTNRLNEPDFHRLARGISESTIVDHKNTNLDKDVETSDGEEWSEPESYYKAEYPHNNVFATHSGIVVEIDNTPANPRIHIFHPSNSYVEINKDGDVIIKNSGDKYDITGKTKNKHTVLNDNETIDENKTKYVKKTEKIKVGKSKTEEIVNGDYTLHVNGKLYISATNGIDIWSGNNVNIDGTQIHLNDGISVERNV